MITLCGFSVSNYYNKVKLALLEKGLPFDEEWVVVGSCEDAVLACSPLGKLPFIRTPQGALCESQVIIDWLEAAHPQPPLVPADHWAAAKLRELCTFIDLHLELVARELYPQAFFGGTASESSKARVRKQLQKNIPAFQQLARFAPYVGGDQFSIADCSAYSALPTVGQATQAVLGEDLLLSAGVDWKAYLKLLSPRPSVQRVGADRKLALQRLATKDTT